MKAACFLRGASAALLIHVSVEIDFRVMQNEPPRHEELKIDSMAHEKFWDLPLKNSTQVLFLFLPQLSCNIAAIDL